MAAWAVGELFSLFCFCFLVISCFCFYKSRDVSQRGHSTNIWFYIRQIMYGKMVNWGFHSMEWNSKFHYEMKGRIHFESVVFPLFVILWDSVMAEHKWENKIISCCSWECLFLSLYIFILFFQKSNTRNVVVINFHFYNKTIFSGFYFWYGWSSFSTNFFVFFFFWVFFCLNKFREIILYRVTNRFTKRCGARYNS